MCTALLLAALIGWAESRTWTDSTGKFKTEATYVRVESGNVVLKKNDGKELTIPIARLSAADQKFLRSLAPPVAAPPVAAPSGTAPPAGGVIESIEKQALTLRTASEAVLLYTKLLTDVSLADLHPQLEVRRSRWVALANTNSLRMGDKWMTLEDAKKLEQAEKQLLEEAERMIEVNNLSLAGERLRKASQANPQSIEADFTIGLVFSLALGQPAEAQKYFYTCVQRRQKYAAVLSNAERANLVAALNNFALVRIRQAEYRPGLLAWQQAIELASPSRELIQNLGKMGALAQTHPHLKIPTGVAREATELYSKVAVAAGANKYNPSTGWLFMRRVHEPTADQLVNDEAVFAPQPDAAPTPGGTTPPTDIVLYGSGSGFVVAPNFVITNRHVIENADAVKIVSSSLPSAYIDATVVAMSGRPDLALVKCAKLDIPPVRLRAELPKLGADMALLGFPEITVLGQTLKATRGILSGMPDKATEEMLLYDAVTNPGNSGGPVCDKYGNVIAVHAAGLGASIFQSLNAGKLGAGVPSQQLISFLSARPEVKVSPLGESKDTSWEEVIESVGKSTVQVLVYQKASKVKLAKRESKSRESDSWDAYEDGWCMTCHGSAIANCPAKGCSNGKISSEVVETIGKTASGTAITKRRKAFTECSHCSGRGKVDCPHCYNGIERRTGQ